MALFRTLKGMAAVSGAILTFAGAPALANGTKQPTASAPRPTATAKPAPKPAVAARPTPVVVVVELATQTINVVLSHPTPAAIPTSVPTSTTTEMRLSQPATVTASATASTVTLALGEFDPTKPASSSAAAAPGWQLYGLPSAVHADKTTWGAVKIDRLIEAGKSATAAKLNNWHLDTHVRAPQDNGLFPSIRARLARQAEETGMIDWIPTRSGTDSIQLTAGVGWTGKVLLVEPTARGTFIPRADFGIHTFEARAGFNGELGGKDVVTFHDVAALQIDADWAANFGWLRTVTDLSLSGELVSGRSTVYIPFWRYRILGQEAIASLKVEEQYLRRWSDNTDAFVFLIGFAGEAGPLTVDVGVAPRASREGGARELGASVGLRF